MATARASFGAVVLANGKVLVAGGTTGGVIITECEIYDPATNSWSSTGLMNVARQSPGLVLLGNGTVLAAGGFNGAGPQSSAELYDPSTGSWRFTGSMGNAVYSAGFAVLSSSSSETTILRAGGIGSNNTYLSTAEIYTASTGNWISTSSMNGARAGFGIVKLTNGDIFVAGGRTSSVILSTAEQYVQFTGVWQTKPSMSTARSRFRLVFLSNGDALAAGGLGGQYLSTAEVYAP
jgi:hypothetical protein